MPKRRGVYVTDTVRTAVDVDAIVLSPRRSRPLLVHCFMTGAAHAHGHVHCQQRLRNMFFF